MQGRFSRRHLLQAGALAAGGTALAAAAPGSGLGGAPRLTSRYGSLAADPSGMLDLPPGFSYRVIAAEGDLLTNGMTVPGHPDGGAAFPWRDGGTVLVHNHELDVGDGPPAEGKRPYDGGQPGGTTAIVLDPDRKVVDQFVVSSGTINNCSGGATPWGTWLTCEEDLTGGHAVEGHGYVFEVDPSTPEDELSRTPIREMGLFSHEALAIDPANGTVYLTEDDFRGRVDKADPHLDTRSAFFYRFSPSDPSPRRGALHRGGTLQALAIEQAPRYNMDFQDPHRRLRVVWRTVDAADPHREALAKGCARFNRLEGCAFGGGATWFADTVGGEHHLGQIYRYVPGTETLELFLEPTHKTKMQSPDSLVVAPWGDLLFCEDGRGHDRLMGIEPNGSVYELAANQLGDGELVGCCFSPDGQTMFLSIQEPGITFAIWGPFASPDAGRKRRLAAGSPGDLGPKLGAEGAEFALRHGISRLEAAAIQRLYGLPF
jgi:secreted PhoX family phosphatase